MINLYNARLQAEKLRDCAVDLSNCNSIIDNSMSQIASADNKTAGPVRNALGFEKEKITKAIDKLYEIASYIENRSNDIYNEELEAAREAARRREEERRRREESRRNR